MHLTVEAITLMSLTRVEGRGNRMKDEKKLQEEMNVLGWGGARDTQAMEFNNEVCDQGFMRSLLVQQ